MYLPAAFFFAAGCRFLRFSALLHLGHDAADDPCSLLLHSAGRVRVDVQRKACAAVTEHRGDRFHVHAALQRGRGEAVSQVMKSDALQSNVLADLPVNLHDGVRVVHFAGYRGREHIGVIRVFLVLLLQQSGRFIRDRDVADGTVRFRRGYSPLPVIEQVLLGHMDGFCLRVEV